MTSAVEYSVLNMFTHPEVRISCIGHIHSWMFDSSWVGQYIQCLGQPKYDGVVPPLNDVVIDLYNNFGVSISDCELAANVLLGYTPPASFDDAISAIQGWIQQCHITQGVEIIASSNTPEYKQRGLESIKTAVSFQLTADTFYDFSAEGVIEKAKEEDFPHGTRVIRSSFNIINKSSSYGGYKNGDLVMVAAESGVGKSTLMCCEGAHFMRDDLRVAYLALGDMTEYDLFIKFMANYLNIESQVIVEEGWQQFVTPEIKEWFKNLRVRAFAPDTLDVHQLLSKANQLYKKFPFHVLMVDYDANIRSINGGDNSYLEGGQTYANLKGYGKGQCVVFTASQTKIQYWGEEVIRKNYANDSSKKQHHVDFMIGLGKHKECDKVGTLNLPKVRRGMTDLYCPVALDNGRGIIREIRREEYDHIIYAHKLAQNGNLTYGMDAAI